MLREPAGLRTFRTIADDLMSPRVVALVGASADVRKTTARPLRFLRAQGFVGDVFVVNPGTDRIGNERVYRSLADLPARPDHVFVLSGTQTVVDVVEECGRLGVPLVTVLASGFGDDGSEGRRRQERLVRVAQENQVRIVGPSSLGVVNPRTGLYLTANAAFNESVPPGGLFVASQSGSILGALASRGKAVGIGFSGLVSVGGEADLSIGEICAAMVGDPEVDSFALFLEALQHPEELVGFAHAAEAAEKPVVYYKLGRSPQAAALSESHTGALAGEDGEAEAFLASCGFIRVHQFEALLEAPRLATRVRSAAHPDHPRVGLLTSTGGGAAMLVDELAMRGVDVVAPSPTLRSVLSEVGVPPSDGLMVDLTLAATRHDVVSRTLMTLQESDEFDLICVVVGSSARANPELAVSAVVERADGSTPLAVFAVPEALSTLRALHDRAIPAFRTPEACADAIAGVLRRHKGTARAGVYRARAHGTRLLDEQESGRRVAQIGISVPISVVIQPDEKPQELPFDYPVVAKGLAREMPHKTELGAVALNLANVVELASAAEMITRNVRERDSRIQLEGILVQPMIPSEGVEVLLGARVSESVGPLIVLAAGGVFTEIYNDSVVKPAPVDEEQARRMIAGVRGLASLRGYRGARRGDEDALVSAIVALSNAIVSDHEMVEIEINPLLVRAEGEGVVALDAAVRIVDRETESEET